MAEHGVHGSIWIERRRIARLPGALGGVRSERPGLQSVPKALYVRPAVVRLSRTRHRPRAVWLTAVVGRAGPVALSIVDGPMLAARGATTNLGRAGLSPAT